MRKQKMTIRLKSKKRRKDLFRFEKSLTCACVTLESSEMERSVASAVCGGTERTVFDESYTDHNTATQSRDSGSVKRSLTGFVDSVDVTSCFDQQRHNAEISLICCCV